MASRIIGQDPAGGDTDRTLGCASEEQLELYAMGRVTPELEATIEEHLLACHRCQDLLNEADEFVTHLRVALTRRSESESRWTRLTSWLSTVGKINKLWIAAPAAALLLAILVAPQLRHTAIQPVDVELRAFRSAPEPTEGSAPPSVPLNLKLSAEGLPGAGNWTADLIDSGGASIQRSGSAVSLGIISVAVPRGLKPGRYWVRLLSPGAAATQVREYGLVVR